MHDSKRLFVLTLLAAVSIGQVAEAATRLNPDLVEGGDVTLHRTSPDGSRIVYRADQDTDDVFELYSIPFHGGESVKLSGPMVDDGDVEFLFRFTPDSSRVLYFADQERDGSIELYSVPVDGSAQPVKLNGPLPEGGGVNPFDFEISEDGRRAVYLADQDSVGQDELYSRMVDGSGLSVKINGPLLPDDGVVKDFEISPDSNTVVYRAIQDAAFREEIYSRPIDGSGTSVKLNSDPVRGGDVLFNYQITPDSGRVVFRGDLEIDQQVQLYSRSIDGSGELATINATLPDEGRVATFRITPDSRRVIYGAEQEHVDTNEIYVRPIDGSGDALKLSHSIAEGGFAFIDDISDDGSQIVYLADENADDVVEAFVVPIDGSRPARKVNGPLVEGGRVVGGQMSPDGEHFIYFADEETVDTIEIFGVPTDGSRESIKLNPPLSDANSASAFGITQDSQFVVTLEGNIFFGTGLYARSLSGGPVLPLNDPLGEGGVIEGLHEIAPDDRTVLFRAKQDATSAFELYAARIHFGGPCDFDGDGMLDVDDLNLLGRMIRTGSEDTSFDVNVDGILDFRDIVEFVTSPDKVNSYIGDANLDGEFNSTDLILIFQAGEYEDRNLMNSSWATGDWNGDGEFDSGDLVVAFQDGGYELGPRSTAILVPESTPSPLPLAVLMSLAMSRRRLR